MSETKKIAVAGATGRVGRHVVDILTAAGHDVVAMSRAGGVDIVTGDGLATALEGVEVVIDVASTPSPDEKEATAFFTTAARNLQEAGYRAGVQRIVAVSIIGIEKFKSGYNVAKLAHERALQEGPVPVQILRAAQFHEFVEQMVQWGTQGDVAYVPRMRTQLVAARTVAQTLVDLALAPAAGGIVDGPFPEIAGPRAEDLVEMAALLARRRGGPARVQGVGDLDDPDQVAYENGGLLPGPHATLGGPTFAEWLG
ncbi:SDR family oxidoreductase [Spirillospora sp. NPDC048911]|uniref:SDR family oxidoreductase n=1 Tax=Spirillospora sp. NPDC048911 TaxID=3364527 RepID=UPI00371F452D